MLCQTNFCGIDVSKDSLDYIVLQSNEDTRLNTRKLKEKAKSFTRIQNDLSSIAQEFGKARFDDTLFILEATGSYSSKLIHQLRELGRPLSVVSPYRSKSYMDSKGVTNKNDKVAAYCLAALGKSEPLRLYKAPSTDMQQRKQTLSVQRALEKQERQLLNQIHALEQYAIPNTEAIESLRIILNSVQAQLTTIETKIYQPAEDPEYAEKLEYGTSVKGIGTKTAEAILLVTSGLTEFEESASVVKFLGIAPGSHQSGSSINKRKRMTKFGSNQVRSLLYMCTRSAIRYNLPCKRLYERLRNRGKSHKVAAGAVMNKLVRQFYTCVMSRTMFDNEHEAKQYADRQAKK